MKDHPSKERILQQLPLFLSHVIPNKVPSVPNYSLITDASSVITNSTKVYIATKEHHGIITGLEQIQQNANLSGNKGLILSVLHAKDQILENLFGIGRQNTIGIMSRGNLDTLAGNIIHQGFSSTWDREMMKEASASYFPFLER